MPLAFTQEDFLVLSESDTLSESESGSVNAPLDLRNFIVFKINKLSGLTDKINLCEYFH